MAGPSIQEKRNDIEKRLNEMLNRANSPKGGFARIYALYQKFQTQRFMSQNASEGDSWKALEPHYAAYKKKKFKSYPGAGTKTLIATGTLAGAVIGPGSPFQGVDKHRAMFLSTKMVIQVEESGTNAAGKPFIYPHFVNEKRDFMTFSQKSLEQMKSELSKFILGV